MDNKVICHSCEKETTLYNARLHPSGAYYCIGCVSKGMIVYRVIMLLNKTLESIKLINETMEEL